MRFALLLVAAPLFGAAGGGATLIDSAGNVWRTGQSDAIVTTATAFQKTVILQACGTEDLSPFQPATTFYCQHAYLTKQDSSGNILYATYLGGSSQDGGTALTADAQGNIYLAGYTYSADFPTTPGAVQTKNSGPTTPKEFTALGAPYGPAEISPGGDVFVAKFAPDGTLLFSTLLGGSGQDVATLIGADASGSAYVAGVTQSTDFPVTANALTGQGTTNFFARLNATGTTLIYSTYFLPSILAFDVDSQGRAYLTGDLVLASDTVAGQPYVAILDTSIGMVVNSEPLTNLKPGLAGAGVAIARTAAQNLMVAVSPAPFPYSFLFNTSVALARNTGASYLFELRPDAGAIFSEADLTQAEFDSIQFDSAGNVYAFGRGIGAMPATPVQLLAVPCIIDLPRAFLVETNAAGAVIAASYFRQGDDTAVAMAAPGHILIYRNGLSTLTMDISAQPSALFACPANLASDIADQGVAPGEIFVITGSGLGPALGMVGAPDAAGLYPTSLGGVQVLFDSKPAPLLYVQANEIHGVAPFNLNSVSAVQVKYGNQMGLPLDVTTTSWNPGIFAINRQGAIVNQDGTVNTPANPAPLGSIVSVYCTGIGNLVNPVVDGSIAPIPPPFDVTELVYLQVKFAGVVGTTLWSGAAPGLIEGVTQVNVRLPASLPAGTTLSAVPTILNAASVLSPPVNISVKQ